MDQYLIAIDVGTQSLRSSVFDTAGNQYFTASYDYSPRFSPGNRAEQAPSSWEEALHHTLSRTGFFLAQQKDKPVACIAITSQRASVIPMDEAGHPLHDALMWQDKRAVRECEQIAEKISPEALYAQCGLRLDPYFSLPKMLYLRNERPDVWEKTKKLIGVQDYICYLLTGKYVTDWSQACRTMLLDLRTFTWNEALLSLLELDRSLLCDLCPPGGVAGTLSESYAAMVDLPAGLPVLLCGGDQQCAALALGLFSPGSATANTGTGSFVLGYAAQPTFDEQQRILCSAAAIPGRWIVEAGIYASGATYNWCRKQLFDQCGADEVTFEQVNREVDDTAPGAGGVVVLPHFQGSAAPHWNPKAKGMFFNMNLGTTRGQMCRALLEGIASEIAENIALIEQNAGEIERVYLAGGLTKFPTYCQILADCLEKPVIRQKNAEATLLGCVMSAAVTLGVYPDYETASAAVANGAGEVFEPAAERVKIYRDLRALKKALYDALASNGIYEMAETLR